MSSTFLHRSVGPYRRRKSTPRRFLHPGVESLENRNLLAFDLSISGAATTGVTTTTTGGTTTFTASASGANLALDAIGAALQAGQNVLISSGSSGTEAGTIATSGIINQTFDNAVGTSLKFQSGTGTSAELGNINLVGLRLAKSGTIIIDSHHQVSLEGIIAADVLTISAGGAIAMPSGGQLQGTTLRLTAGGDLGTAANPVLTNVNQLTTNTSASNRSQFISAAGQSTAVKLNAGTGAITLVGGTFNLASGDALGDNSTLIVNSPVTVNLAGNDETVGGLAGGGTVAFKQDGAGQTLSVGGNNQDTTFSGNLAGDDLVGNVSQDFFRKLGSGTLTLSGANAFTGNYKVLAGKLLVTGSLATSTRPLIAFPGSGAVLGGTGTLNRPTLIIGDSHLAPGNTGPGVLSTSQLQLFAGSTFDVEITSAAAGNFDQVNVAGVGTSVTLDTTGAGVALKLQAFGTLNLHDGDELVLIKNDGVDAVSGTFAGYAEGENLSSDFLGAGLTAKITYVGGDGNDVALKLSPGSRHPWHNDSNPFDVRGSETIVPDGRVAAGDVLAIINYINSTGPGPVPANAISGLPYGFLDTDSDNKVAAGDALAVINVINARQPQEAEATAGEAPPESSLANAASPFTLGVTIDELLTLLAVDSASQSGAARRR